MTNDKKLGGSFNKDSKENRKDTKDVPSIRKGFGTPTDQNRTGGDPPSSSTSQQERKPKEK
jgi:hypothetical protein